ncbi:MAG: hypothetical protein O7F08_09250, partial [Deltaproteobacteria bacterium]|nr:hypothetical protein [Deltaproteobacteria bacterium]
NRKNNPIDLEGARQAIYLDFEGPGRPSGGEAPPPMFAGTLIEGQYAFWVLDPVFQGLAESKEIPFASLDGFLAMTLQIAQLHSRRVVFWSSHEETIFSEGGYAPDGIGFDLKIPAKEVHEARFNEFRKTEQRWKNPKTPKTTKTKLKSKAFGLLTLLAADLGLPRPKGYGPGLVGKWISTMREQAVSKTHYEKWATSGKAAATKLRNHNKHDCEATEFLLKQLLGA